MRLIIAGSREIDQYRAFYESLSLVGYNHEYGNFYINDLTITTFITGDCSTGADRVPYMLDKITGYEKYDMPIESFPADWKKHGRAAGPIRNREMAKYSDVLLLIWDGKSKGSSNMKKEMEKLDKLVYEVIVK